MKSRQVGSFFSSPLSADVWSALHERSEAPGLVQGPELHLLHAPGEDPPLMVRAEEHFGRLQLLSTRLLRPVPRSNRAPVEPFSSRSASITSVFGHFQPKMGRFKELSMSKKDSDRSEHDTATQLYLARKGRNCLRHHVDPCLSTLRPLLGAFRRVSKLFSGTC